MTRRTLLLLASAAACLASPALAGDDSHTRNEPTSEIQASELSKPPKLIRQATLIYPKEAAEKRIEAEIKLAIDLDEKGEVVGAAVLEPKTPTGMGFEEAALAAAYQLGFEPAEMGGKPVTVQIVYTFKFVPPKPAPTPPPASPDAGAPSEAGVAVPEAGPAAPEQPARAPVDNFSGKVIERGTRLPMAGVMVTIYRNDGSEPQGFEAPTDAQGTFHFFDLASGTWKVLIEAPGYYPFRTTEDIRTGEGIRATYHVERGSYNEFDQVVTAERPRKEVSRVIIEREVIDKMPGAMGDPLAVLQNFAGVARVEGTGQLIVRGSNPDDSRVFVDGAEVPIVYHLVFGGLRSVLPSGMVENLEFYPGNFSPYFGRATAGVVDVTTKKLKPKKIGGYFDINLLDSGFYLEAPIGEKAAVAVSARRSYIDYILNAVIPDNAPISMIQAPKYYDYQLLGTYRPAAAHDLRLFIFGSDDRFAMIFKNPGALGTQITNNRLNLSTTFYRASASWKYVPGDHFENIMRLSQGRDIADIEVFQFIEDLTLDSTHWRDTAHIKLTDKLTLVSGFDALVQHWTGFVRMPSPPREGENEEDINLDKFYEARVDEYHWLPAAFAELEYNPIKELLLVPGVRVDYFSDISQLTVAPRLNARYQLSPKITLKGGIGLFYQEPDVASSNKDFGNPNLKAEHAIHYSAGVEYKPRQHITLDATGFYKDLGSLVSRTDAVSKEADPLTGKHTPLRYDNNGDGRAYGIELVAKHALTRKFTGWLSYTLSRSTRLDSGATEWRLFQYDQTHILNLFWNYKLPRNWEIGSRLRFVSGNPTTPVVGSVYNATTDAYQPTYGSPYSGRVDYFMQFDLRVDKKWIFDTWMLNAYLDIQNVTNHSNVESVRYNFDYRQSGRTQGLPIYPILGLRGEF